MKKKFVSFTLTSIAFIFLTGYMPVLGSLLLFVSVVPQMDLLYENKFVQAAGSWLIVLTAIVFLKSWVFLYTYSVIYILYAGLYYFLLKKYDGALEIVIKAAGIWIGLWTVWLISTKVLFDINFLKELTLFLKSGLAESVGGLYSLDFEIKQLAMVENSFVNMLEFFRKSFFGLAIILSFAGSAVVYYILSLKKESIKRISSFVNFRLPREMVWLFLGGGVLYLGGNLISRFNIINLLGGNLSIIFLTGYMLTGVSLAVFLFDKWNTSIWVRNILIVLIFLFTSGFFIFTIAGIADVWVDFRKLNKAQ
ncbi:MAG: DUF2232 domain-containing protein [Elusimicrobiota bacterium]